MSRGFSLRGRLTVSMLLVFALGLAAAATLFYVEVGSARADLRDRTLRSQARDLLASLHAEPDGRLAPRLSGSWADAYARPRSGFYFTLYDSAGRPVASSPDLAAPLPRLEVPPGETYGRLDFTGVEPDRLALVAARAPAGHTAVVGRGQPDPEMLAESVLLDEDYEYLYVLAPFVLLSLVLVWLDQRLEPAPGRPRLARGGRGRAGEPGGAHHRRPAAGRDPAAGGGGQRRARPPGPRLCGGAAADRRRRPRAADAARGAEPAPAEGAARRGRLAGDRAGRDPSRPARGTADGPGAQGEPGPWRRHPGRAQPVADRAPGGGAGPAARRGGGPPAGSRRAGRGPGPGPRRRPAGHDGEPARQRARARCRDHQRRRAPARRACRRRGERRGARRARAAAGGGVRPLPQGARRLPRRRPRARDRAPGGARPRRGRPLPAGTRRRVEVVLPAGRPRDGTGAARIGPPRPGTGRTCTSRPGRREDEVATERDEIAWAGDGREVRVGVERRGEGPAVLPLPAPSSI